MRDPRSDWTEEELDYDARVGALATALARASGLLEISLLDSTWLIDEFVELHMQDYSIEDRRKAIPEIHAQLESAETYSLPKEWKGLIFLDRPAKWPDPQTNPDPPQSGDGDS